MIERIRAVIDNSHERTVLHTLGVSIDKIDADETIMSLTIDDRHRQNVGLVHGGIYVLLAESAASVAGACTLTDEHSGLVGIEINANHVGSKKSGRLIARSKCLHKGKQTMVYQVSVVDENEQLISTARTTLLKLGRK